MPPLPTPPGFTEHPSGLVVPTDLKADALSDLRHPTAWMVDWAGGRRSHAGVPVSPQTSMALAAYYDCIRAIAEDCGKLPLQIIRRTDAGRTPATDSLLWPILHDQFNADMSAMIGREVMTAHALGWGNGYGYLLRDRGMGMAEGDVTGIYPLHPARVRPWRDQETQRLWYRYTYSSADRLARSDIPTMIPAEDMLHLRGPSPDGICGYSICQIASESLGLSLAAQEYGAGFFGNAATPSGILRHPGRLTDPARDNLRASWERLHAGPANTGRVAILEEGLDWASITIPPEQAQFLATRTFQLREICRWFRMPPHKVGDLEHAHYTNVEQQNIEYVVDTLGSWLVRWEQEIQAKLLAGQRGLLVKHNVNALLRGDMAARSAFYREMIMSGVYSPNVVLELEDMDGYEGGDEHFMQLAMAPVRKIIDGTARQPAAPRGAVSPADPTQAVFRNGHRTLTIDEHDYAR